MSVVLLILKIVGCILLSLLIFLLLAVVAVIFVPFQYRITAQAKDDIEVDLRLHWLLYLICFRLKTVNGEKEAAIRFLGIKKQIYPANPDRKKRRRKRAVSKDKSAEKRLEEPVFVAQEVSPDFQDESAASSEDAQCGEKNAENKNCRPIFSKIRSFGRFFKAIPGKIKNMQMRLSAGWRILTDEANRQTTKLVTGELWYLLVHFRPRKLFADICYCAGNPAYTGKILAVLCMIPFLYQKKVQIVPDFESEQPYVRGMLKAKGHVRSFHLVRSGLYIWRDKNIKQLIRKIRQ